MWNKTKKKYKRCIECKTNQKRYHGLGLCESCYLRRRSNLPKRKKYERTYYLQNKKKLGIFKATIRHIINLLKKLL